MSEWSEDQMASGQVPDAGSDAAIPNAEQMVPAEELPGGDVAQQAAVDVYDAQRTAGVETQADTDADVYVREEFVDDATARDAAVADDDKQAQLQEDAAYQSPVAAAATAGAREASAAGAVQDRRTIVQKGTEQADARVRARSQSTSATGSAAVDFASTSAVAEELSQAAASSNPFASAATQMHAQPSSTSPMLLLINGSPRKHTCSSLIDLIEDGAREQGVRTQRFELYNKRINPCVGCNACARTGYCAYAGKSTRKTGFIDDYLELVGLLERCDGLAVVAPVYFSGPTSQLKALYDRFQPYWARKYVLGQPFPQRRPSQLFVVGTGGDPHGFDPVVTISRSALQIAGFELEKINNFVGFMAPQDVPARPTREQADAMTPRELSQLVQRIERQESLRTRALEAGRAFGRILCGGGPTIRSQIKDDIPPAIPSE